MGEFDEAIRRDFLSFLILFFHLQTKRPLRVTPLVQYVASIYQGLHEGSRLVINKPPRCLKSWEAKCFAAWRMGLDPSERIIFLSATTDLAEDTVYDVRSIMRSAEFKSVFPNTRIAKDRSGLTRLRTTKGGSFFAGSMNSALGGVGATIILIDDGNRIDDCDNPERLERANRKFDTEILSRLDPDSGRKKKGIIVNTQHRIAYGDQSGHQVREHGFDLVAFPLIATRRTEYVLDDGKVWIREAGDILVDSYSKREIERAKKSQHPPYFYFYQQGQGNNRRAAIPPTAFPLVTKRPGAGTHVISIDAAQRDDGSFNVAQVWNVAARPLHLQEQFRAQCGFVELEIAVTKLIMRFSPQAVVIENAANGTALLARLKVRFADANFVAVEARGSKDERLDRHRNAIARGVISLQKEPWADDYIREFEGFPKHGTDQVDATTQMLDYLATNPHLTATKPVNRGIAGAFASTGQPIEPPNVSPTMQLRGAVLVTGSSILAKRR